MIEPLSWTYRIASDVYDHRSLLFVEGELFEAPRIFTELPRHPFASASDNGRLSFAHNIEAIDTFVRGGGLQGELRRVKSYDHMWRVACVTGDKKLVQRAEQHLVDTAKFIEARLAPLRGRRLVRIWGDEGDELDRERIAQGEDDVAWTRLTHIDSVRQSRVVNLDVSLDVSGDGDGSLAWNGVQAVMIADALESLGFRVNIHVFECSTNTGTPFYTMVRALVKRADEPLRIDLLATQCGHLGVPRLLLWPAFHAHAGIASYGGVVPRDIASGLLMSAALSNPPDHILPPARSQAAAEAAFAKVVDMTLLPMAGLAESPVAC